MNSAKDQGADFTAHSQNGFVSNGTLVNGTLTLDGISGKSYKTNDATCYAINYILQDAWHWGTSSSPSVASGDVSVARNTQLIQMQAQADGATESGFLLETGQLNQNYYYYASFT